MIETLQSAGYVVTPCKGKAPVRPLVLLGADWSPRVVDGTWVDVQRLMMAEQNLRTEA